MEAVRDTAARLAPAARDRDQLRPIEDRFLALQPRLDGSLTGYFGLDAASGATLLEAIESAAPPPSAGRRTLPPTRTTPPPSSPWCRPPGNVARGGANVPMVSSAWPRTTSPVSPPALRAAAGPAVRGRVSSW